MAPSLKDWLGQAIRPARAWLAPQAPPARPLPQARRASSPYDVAQQPRSGPRHARPSCEVVAEVDELESARKRLEQVAPSVLQRSAPRARSARVAAVRVAARTA